MSRTQHQHRWEEIKSMSDTINPCGWYYTCDCGASRMDVVEADGSHETHVEEPQMSRTTQEVSLLEYVIAYLQKELRRYQSNAPQRIGDWNSRVDVGILVDDALDAYAGGAR